jgi:hypothetical protein
MHTIGALVTSTLFLLAITGRGLEARACGVWSMTDKGLKREVRFYVETVNLKRPGRAGSGAAVLRIKGKRFDRMYGTIGNRKLFQIEGDTLRRRGRVVGTVRGETLKLGKRIYTISLGYTPKESAHQRWALKVRQGDKLIIEGRAMPLCGMGVTWDPPDLQDDEAYRARVKIAIRNRVILYLAWRQLIRRR